MGGTDRTSRLVRFGGGGGEEQSLILPDLCLGDKLDCRRTGRETRDRKAISELLF